MTYDRFELFEAYTANTLPANQREQFEQELANDAAIRAELADYQQFRFSIESIKLKQQLETIHTRLDRQGVLTEAPPSPTVMPVRQRFRPLGVVAGVIVVLLVGLGWYWTTRPMSAEQVFMAYYRPEPVGRGKTDCARDLTPGVQQYRAKNYNEALSLFQKLPDNLACMPYYRGITQLALNHPSEAIAELERALTYYPDHADLTHQKAGWYLALAYLNANRTADARARFQAIAQQQGHPFGAESKKVLADLGDE